jgi:hypothetical protein
MAWPTMCRALGGARLVWEGPERRRAWEQLSHLLCPIAVLAKGETFDATAAAVPFLVEHLRQVAMRICAHRLPQFSLGR